MITGLRTAAASAVAVRVCAVTMTTLMITYNVASL